MVGEFGPLVYCLTKIQPRALNGHTLCPSNKCKKQETCLKIEMQDI